MRTVTAAFDTVVMALVAFGLTGGGPDLRPVSIALWGSAASALVVTLATRGAFHPAGAWMGIGFIAYAALLASRDPILPLLALAVALAPVAPTPRKSLAIGLGVAAVSAFVFDEVFRRVIGG